MASFGSAGNIAQLLIPAIVVIAIGLIAYLLVTRRR
jgi:hypothetical protein